MALDDQLRTRTSYRLSSQSIGEGTTAFEPLSRRTNRTVERRISPAQTG